MQILNELIARYPTLKSCQEDILQVYEIVKNTFEQGKTLYICGNGGSASDALHMVGELSKSFVLKRTLDSEFCANASSELIENLQGSLPAVALVENSALSSAYANDVNPQFVFAQQVYTYVRKGDCVMGISTSGNSQNVLWAMQAAKCRGAKTVGLTGKDGGKLKTNCDAAIIVPESETYKIQELHLPIYHAICMMLEKHFWGGNE